MILPEIVCFTIRMSELDFDGETWNYEEVIRSQNPELDLFQIKQRIKLAQITQEQTEYKLNSRYERQQTEGEESLKIRILENQVKTLKIRLQKENEINQVLMSTNSQLKSKIEKHENRIGQNKAEIEVIVEAFIMDEGANYDELTTNLKNR